MEQPSPNATAPGGGATPVKLGDAETDINGRFRFTLTDEKINADRPPNLYFDVYQGKTLLKSTQGYVIWNGNTQEDVTIKIGDQVIPLNGKNRLTTVQGFAIGKFLAQSDFTGLFTQTKSQIGTSFAVFGDAIVNSISKVNLTPIKVPVQSSKIVNNDLPTATRQLTDQNIKYNVMDYNPALNADLITNFSGYASALKPGQTVNLYQQNGVVKYYSVVPANVTPPAAAPSPQVESVIQRPILSPLAPPDDIAKMQEDLTAMQNNSAEKDKQIALLTAQLAAVTKDQADMKALFNAKFPS